MCSQMTAVMRTLQFVFASRANRACCFRRASATSSRIASECSSTRSLETTSQIGVVLEHSTLPTSPLPRWNELFRFRRGRSRLNPDPVCRPYRLALELNVECSSSTPLSFLTPYCLFFPRVAGAGAQSDHCQQECGFQHLTRIS